MMTFEEFKKVFESAMEKKENICELLSNETNAQPVYRVIGAIVAMDQFSKALKANLEAEGIDWNALYVAISETSTLKVVSAFDDLNAPGQNEKES